MVTRATLSQDTHLESHRGSRVRSHPPRDTTLLTDPAQNKAIICADGHDFIPEDPRNWAIKQTEPPPPDYYRVCVNCSARQLWAEAGYASCWVPA